jgi:hypothetical protein
MKWYEFIVIYWAQVFAIVGLFVGAFKIWLDYRNKRLEIKHNLFFKEKMSAILSFYNAYFQASSILRDFIGRATHNVQSTRDFDTYVYPKQQELRSAYQYLEFLLDENELQPFGKILDNINNAGQMLFDYNYRNRENDKDLQETLNNPIYYIESKCITVNNKYFKIISTHTKKFYGMAK